MPLSAAPFKTQCFFKKLFNYQQHYDTWNIVGVMASSYSII